MVHNQDDLKKGIWIASTEVNSEKEISDSFAHDSCFDDEAYVSVSPADVNSVPSIGTPLNTIESIMLADGNIIDTSLFPNLVTDGTKIVDIEGMPRQGVLIYSVGEEGEYQGLPRIFYWTDNGWTILSEGMLDISVAGLWDRENAARLSSEDAAVIV